MDFSEIGRNFFGGTETRFSAGHVGEVEPDLGWKMALGPLTQLFRGRYLLKMADYWAFRPKKPTCFHITLFHQNCTHLPTYMQIWRCKFTYGFILSLHQSVQKLINVVLILRITTSQHFIGSAYLMGHTCNFYFIKAYLLLWYYQVCISMWGISATTFALTIA